MIGKEMTGWENGRGNEGKKKKKEKKKRNEKKKE